MLGHIRDELDGRVRAVVAEEIAKDLVKLPHNRLVEAIGEHQHHFLICMRPQNGRRQACFVTEGASCLGWYNQSQPERQQAMYKFLMHVNEDQSLT